MLPPVRENLHTRSRWSGGGPLSQTAVSAAVVWSAGDLTVLRCEGRAAHTSWIRGIVTVGRSRVWRGLRRHCSGGSDGNGCRGWIVNYEWATDRVMARRELKAKETSIYINMGRGAERGMDACQAPPPSPLSPRHEKWYMSITKEMLTCQRIDLPEGAMLGPRRIEGWFQDASVI